MARTHTQTTLEIGSYSSGTLKTDDLLQAIADALDDLRLSRQERASVREAYRLLNATEEEYGGRDDDSNAWEEDASWVLDDLYDAASSHCPPYTFFGGHEGDPADIGCWPSIDSLEDDARSGEVLKVNDLADVPKGHSSMVMEVNDHGNVTLWRYSRGRRREVWSVA